MLCTLYMLYTLQFLCRLARHPRPTPPPSFIFGGRVLDGFMKLLKAMLPRSLQATPVRLADSCIRKLVWPYGEPHEAVRGGRHACIHAEGRYTPRYSRPRVGICLLHNASKVDSICKYQRVDTDTVVAKTLATLRWLPSCAESVRTHVTAVLEHMQAFWRRRASPYCIVEHCLRTSLSHGGPVDTPC